VLVHDEPGLVAQGRPAGLERPPKLVQLAEATLHVLTEPLGVLRALAPQGLELARICPRLRTRRGRVLRERPLDDRFELGRQARLTSLSRADWSLRSFSRI